uniref:Peptidase S1 domain-containing protein n=1 Tax=Steinernema glaseri TaxID=37863 RepID=A0A1I7XZS7_9BILA
MQILLLAFFCALSLGLPVPEGAPSELITNGHRASPGQFPFFAWLQLPYEDGYLGHCGASVLTERFLLTAYHCLSPVVPAPHDQLVAYFNVTDKDALSPPTVQTIQIKEVHLYPQEEELKDIAVLELVDPIAKDFFQPVKVLRDDDALVEPGAPVLGLGLGRTGPGWGPETVASHLLYAEMAVVDNEKCGRAYSVGDEPSAWPSDILCAGKGQSATSSGDSGGPLMAGEVQVGVSSFAVLDSLDKETNPSGFARVAKYCDFIEKATRNTFLCA